jgi:transposase
VTFVPLMGWSGRAPAPPASEAGKGRQRLSQTLNTAMAVIGIDIGKNSFHVVGHDARGAIVLRQKWSRGQVEARLANIPPCLIGIEACLGAHQPTASTGRTEDCTRPMPLRQFISWQRGSHPQKTS